MQHAISQVMKCMRLSKNWSSRPVYQLAASVSTGNHLKSSLYTTVYQPGNHWSVIIGARQPISQLGGILHHSDDSVGPFWHDTSVCRSQRGSNLGSTINQKAQYAAVDRLIRSTTGNTIPSSALLEGLKNLARTETPRKADRNKSDHVKRRRTAAAGGGAQGGRRRRG
ncbi:RING/U-box superfamily protein [Dorcoceras hygrometricum]|uniref:RING/U-box superfamily protein n=1 Tax=Dorcoceras hygrometricum TaxID=472368 RepID=A0A2Z7C5X5_9LAMI|nr:RING/U-box superfamily protein [Dorcoceras hygrometricum]